jgi:hypothetical protein
MSEKRVKFDFEIAFTNGGGLTGWDFRLDIAGDEISDEELAAYIIRDLRLLMVGYVHIRNKAIITEPHKRTPPAKGELSTGFVDLRSTSPTLEQLFAQAAQATIRVITPDGDSYLIRHAAKE